MKNLISRAFDKQFGDPIHQIELLQGIAREIDMQSRLFNMISKVDRVQEDQQREEYNHDEDPIYTK